MANCKSIALLIVPLSIFGVLAIDGLRLYNAPELPPGNRIQPSGGNSRTIRIKHGGLAIKDCQFALKMYRQLSSESDGNVLFSPLSILTAISALAEGANGTTARELLSVMNRTTVDGSQYRTRIVQILNRMNAKGGTNLALNVASRLYIQQDYPVLPNFQQTLEHYYKMETVSLDFESSQSVEQSINDWVARTTSQRITTLVPPGTLDPLTRMVLANAIYFKGDWETTFPEANTRLRPFYSKRDKYVQVPMMMVESDFPYYDYTGMGFEMIELPYVGKEVSMFVVLPHEGQSLNAVSRRLLQRPLLVVKPSRRMYSNTITVVLPKFKLEDSVDLKPSLYSLGVRQAFEQDKADFSGIGGNGELYVSDVLHSATVEVSEKGTKAAAATAVVIKGRSMSSDPVFRADRPFLFFIRHNPTETVLFLGHVKQLKDETPNAPKFRSY